LVFNTLLQTECCLGRSDGNAVAELADFREQIRALLSTRWWPNNLPKSKEMRRICNQPVWASFREVRRLS
jgi:hypothetical protein